MKTEEFKKILLDAIDKEVEAYTFYTSASERVKDAALKTVFKELAEQESMHRKTLQAYLMGAKTELKFNETQDYKLSDTIGGRNMATSPRAWPLTWVPRYEVTITEPRAAIIAPPIA